MSSYLSFESDRLYLRPTTEEDAALVLAILTAPKALKFIGDRNLHSEEDAREYIRHRALVQLRERGYANYTLVTKETGTKVGVCGLYVRPDLELIDSGLRAAPGPRRPGLCSRGLQAHHASSKRALWPIKTERHHPRRKHCEHQSPGGPGVRTPRAKNRGRIRRAFRIFRGRIIVRA